jgi:type IV secretion system protein VirB5
MINKIKAFIFGKVSAEQKEILQNQSQRTEAKKSKSNEVENPYVKGAEGRKEWNDRYMNMAQAVKKWQLAFFVTASLLFAALIIIAVLSTQSKIKPYVVETNQGVPYAIKSVDYGISDKDQLLVNYAINQFVINAKTIIADTQAEKLMLGKVYAYSAGNTVSFLQDFYAKNNPFAIAGDYTVDVNIINSLRMSGSTWQITWEETKRRTNGGALMGTTKWVGHFTYKFGEVDSKRVTANPFGIYITNISWSQSQ